MKLHLAKRHWFVEEQALSVLEHSVCELEHTRDLLLSESSEVSLSLLVSTDHSKITPEQDQRARSAIQRIGERGFRVLYSRYADTAGQKFVSHLFSQDRSDVSAMCCLDQYPLSTPEHAQAALEIANKLFIDSKLYSNGSRSVSVNLGMHRKPSEMRIIHELINTMTCPEGVFYSVPPSWANPSVSYQDIGESTSGFYLINKRNDLYGALRSEVKSLETLFSKPGFAIEYFTAIWAGLRNAVSTGYVHAAINPFYSAMYSSAESRAEEERVRGFLKNQHRLIGQTSIAPDLHATLSKPETTSILRKYYEPSIIEETIALMTEGLEESA